MAHYYTIRKKTVKKIPRKCWCPVFDIELNVWCKRKNIELREITEVLL